MSGADDKLDEKTNSAWREASREQPPPAIDAALHAAARRAVQAGPARSRHMQSWPLMAAAIVAFLAIGILQLTPPEEVTPGAERDATVRSPAPRRVEPASATAPAAPVLDAAAPSVTAPAPPPDASKPLARSAAAGADQRSEMTADAIQSERATERKKAEAPEPASAVESLNERQTRANADTAQAPSRADANKLAVAAAKVPAAPGAGPASPPPAPEPFPAPPPVTGSAPSAAGTAQETLPAKRGAGALPSASAGAVNAPAETERAADQAPAPMALAKSAATGAKDAPKPPDEWIKLIRRLRSEGHNDEALRELTAFRAAYKERAEELLPADLRSLR
ncbi:MAG TPA: hypothetical protein VGH59_16570 [Casimicrobiaceae bacterium]